MRAGWVAAIILATGMLLDDVRAEPVRPSPLSSMVASLQRLQDAIADGDPAARKAHSLALRKIGEIIEASPSETWNDEQERNSAVIYLLSGGSPVPVARSLESVALAAGDGALLRGALAYASGRRVEASRLLSQFDPRATGPRLGGQLAYVQADCMSRDEHDKLLAALDLARLLAPGGLVEETALRREILISGEARDFDRFSLLSREYARRFPRSPYYDSFRQILSGSLERMSLQDQQLDPTKYEALAAALPSQEQLAALLAVARSAVLNAKPQTAIRLSQTAMKLPSITDIERTRARLYLAAARLLTEDDSAQRELKQDERLLERRDIALLAAVRKVAGEIAAEVTSSGHESEKDKGPVEGPASATIQAAEVALGRADSLLQTIKEGSP